jgi:hypothetical protein
VFRAGHAVASVAILAAVVATGRVSAQDRLDRPGRVTETRTVRLAREPAPAPAPAEPEYVEGQPAPPGYEVVSGPRLWTLVTGALIYVPTYGLALHGGTVGDAGGYGSHRVGEDPPFHFGTKQYLLIPVLGPPLFMHSFCADATEHYKEYPSSDEPQDACRSSGWVWAGLQGVGAGLIAASFAWPSKRLVRVSSGEVAAHDWHFTVVRTRRGTPLWLLGGSF